MSEREEIRFYAGDDRDNSDKEDNKKKVRWTQPEIDKTPGQEWDEYFSKQIVTKGNKSKVPLPTEGPKRTLAEIQFESVYSGLGVTEKSEAIEKIESLVKDFETTVKEAEELYDDIHSEKFNRGEPLAEAKDRLHNLISKAETFDGLFMELLLEVDKSGNYGKYKLALDRLDQVRSGKRNNEKS